MTVRTRCQIDRAADVCLVKPMVTDCNHPEDGVRRHYRVSWCPALVCEACLATAAAANRVRCASIGPVEWMHVHGTGLVPRKPTLDNYERTASLPRGLE